MLDIRLIREHPDIVRADLDKRKDTKKRAYLDRAIALDRAYRERLQRIEGLRHDRNAVSKEIAEAKKAGKDAASLLKRAASIPDEIAKLEEENALAGDELRQCLYALPNILHGSVPYGEGEEGNEVVKLVGKKPVFSFTPKSHVDILADLGLADLDRAAKIAGARFFFLKGDGALLNLALQRYAVDFMQKKGYLLTVPPYLMQRRPYEGVIDLGDFGDVMYKVEGEDLHLIATAEHPLVAQYMDEILEGKELPIRLVGISPCFRKEAGTHGKDTKGIFRVHQFTKIEQVALSRPEDSWDLHEELIGNAEEFFESLGLHFRRVNICTGDIGTVAAKKYDLEAWSPVQQAYREVVSASNCTDYQARRLHIRYRTAEGNLLVHTLNSTVVAIERAMALLLENCQQEDGTIRVPDVLVPYMGKKVIGKRE